MSYEFLVKTSKFLGNSACFEQGETSVQGQTTSKYSIIQAKSPAQFDTFRRTPEASRGQAERNLKASEIQVQSKQEASQRHSNKCKAELGKRKLKQGKSKPEAGQMQAKGKPKTGPKQVGAS
jgi:tryptophan 2,3-dioxygenase